jgi:hypothetical protein
MLSITIPNWGTIDKSEIPAYRQAGESRNPKQIQISNDKNTKRGWNI